MGITTFTPGTRIFVKRPKTHHTKDAWLYHSCMSAFTRACQSIPGIAYEDTENVDILSLASFFEDASLVVEDNMVFDDVISGDATNVTSANIIHVLHHSISSSNSVFQACEVMENVLVRMMEILASDRNHITRFLAAWCVCVILFRARHRDDYYRSLRSKIKATTHYKPSLIETWFGGDNTILRLEGSVTDAIKFASLPKDVSAPILSASSSEDVTHLREQDTSLSNRKAMFCARLPFSLVFAWLSFEYHCLWRKKPSAEIVEQCAKIIWNGMRSRSRNARWAAVASIAVLSQCCDFMLFNCADEPVKADTFVLCHGILKTFLLQDYTPPSPSWSGPVYYESLDVDHENMVSLLLLLQSVLRSEYLFDQETIHDRNLDCIPAIIKILNNGLKGSSPSAPAINLMTEAVKCFQLIVKSASTRGTYEGSMSEYLQPMLPHLARCLSMRHNETAPLKALQTTVRHTIISILGDGDFSETNHYFVQAYFALVLRSIPSLIRLHHLVEHIYNDVENESLRIAECKILNVPELSFTSLGAFSQAIQEITHICTRQGVQMDAHWCTTSFNACTLMQHFANLLFHVRPTNAQMLSVFEHLLNVTKDNFDIWAFISQVSLKFTPNMLIRRSNAWMACLKSGLSFNETQDTLKDMEMFSVYTLSNGIMDALLKPWRHGKIPDKQWLERRAFCCNLDLLGEYDSIFSEQSADVQSSRRTRVLKFIMSWSMHVNSEVGLPLNYFSTSFKSLISSNFEPFSHV